MTGAFWSGLGERYKRLGLAGAVCLAFYYCSALVFLLLSILTHTFLDTLVLLAHVATLWTLDRRAYWLAIVSQVVMIAYSFMLAGAWGLLLLILYGWAAGDGCRPNDSFLTAAAVPAIVLAVYHGLCLLFFVHWRGAFGIGSRKNDKRNPPEDPWDW